MEGQKVFAFINVTFTVETLLIDRCRAACSLARQNDCTISFNYEGFDVNVDPGCIPSEVEAHFRRNHFNANEKSARSSVRESMPVT